MVITPTKLQTILKESAKGATFIGITFETEPKLKKNCPYTNVKKTTTANLMLGVNYANRLAKDGLEPAGCAPWWTMVDNQDWLVQHNVKKTFYLRLSPTGNSAPKITYMSDQGPLTKDDLEPYFYAKGTGKIEVFTVAFDNIKELTLNKVTYTLLDPTRFSTTVPNVATATV